MTSPYPPNPWEKNNGFQQPTPQVPPLVAIGDISCTQTHIVTPSGTAPIAGASWHVTDMSHTSEEIPTWAIVCAVVGAFVVCLFSLFFLLAKERRTTGFVQVTVTSGGFMHTTSVPVFDPSNVMDVYNRVAYARNLSGVQY